MIRSIVSSNREASASPLEGGTAVSASASPASVVQKDTAPAQYYTSPVVRIDSATQTVVLEYRSSATGDVVEQLPSVRKLQAYQQQKQSERTNPESSVSAIPASAVTIKSAETAVEAYGRSAVAAAPVATSAPAAPVSPAAVQAEPEIPQAIAPTAPPAVAPTSVSA